MARLLVPATCYNCGGVKVIYRSTLRDHPESEFRTAELLQSLAAQTVTSLQCPVCKGRGTTDVLVRS